MIFKVGRPARMHGPEALNCPFKIGGCDHGAPSAGSRGPSAIGESVQSAQ
jgi:hypothetical protein